MSDYARANTGGATHFGDKDALTTGDANKVIVGSQYDTEFNAIVTAIATKYDSDDLASQAEAEALTLNTKLLTPHTLNDVLVDNAGMLGDIQALADPNADTFLGWDDSAGAVINFSIGTGLAATGTTIATDDANINHDALSNFVADEHVAHSGVDIIAGTGLTGGGVITTSRTLNVIGGNGITANANDIALTDQAVSATVPVGLTSGALTFDMSSITEIDIENISQSADGILVSDAGVAKILPMDKVGAKIVAASTLTINADTEVNVIYVNTTATDYTATIEAESTKDYPIGTEIGFICESTGTITLAINGADTINSIDSNLVVKASGGGAYIVKTGNGTWTLIGDLEA